MILRNIYMQPEPLDYPDSVKRSFRDRNRCFTNYIQRHIRSLRYETKGFNCVTVIGRTEINNGQDLYINCDNILCVEIPFDEKKYVTLEEETELNEFFIEMLETGITKAAKEYDIPVQAMQEGIKDFRAGGYVNEWKFKARMFRDIGIKCILNCKLTMQAFHLYLQIMKGKEEIFNEEIYTSLPDEICFHNELKDVILVDDKIVVIGKLNNAVYEVKLSDLGL